jgi:hypothetical protein
MVYLYVIQRYILTTTSIASSVQYFLSTKQTRFRLGIPTLPLSGGATKMPHKLLVQIQRAHHPKRKISLSIAHHENAPGLYHIRNSMLAKMHTSDKCSKNVKTFQKSKSPFSPYFLFVKIHKYLFRSLMQTPEIKTLSYGLVIPACFG